PPFPYTTRFRSDQGFGIETRSLVRSSRGARSELTDGSRGNAGPRLAMQGESQQGFSFLLSLTSGRVDDGDNPLHEVVGEIQAAVVAACPEQWGIPGAFLREHDGSVEPSQGFIAQLGPKLGKESALRVTLWLGLQSSPSQNGAYRRDRVA